MIFVKSLDGKSYPLEYVRQDTIQILLEKIDRVANVPFYQQRLMFNGKEISGDEYQEKTIMSLNIRKEDTLHLVLRMDSGNGYVKSITNYFLSKNYERLKYYIDRSYKDEDFKNVADNFRDSLHFRFMVTVLQKEKYSKLTEESFYLPEKYHEMKIFEEFVSDFIDLCIQINEIPWIIPLTTKIFKRIDYKKGIMKKIQEYFEKKGEEDQKYWKDIKDFFFSEEFGL